MATGEILLFFVMTPFRHIFLKGVCIAMAISEGALENELRHPQTESNCLPSSQGGGEGGWLARHRTIKKMGPPHRLDS